VLLRAANVYAGFRLSRFTFAREPKEQRGSLSQCLVGLFTAHSSVADTGASRLMQHAEASRARVLAHVDLGASAKLGRSLRVCTVHASACSMGTMHGRGAWQGCMAECMAARAELALTSSKQGLVCFGIT
jgi:hypothetical protein